MRNNKASILRNASGILSSLASVIFWLTIIFGFEEPAMAVATIFAAVIHELGHILYLWRTTGEGNIRGVLSGFRIKPGSELSYGQEFLLYLSGPAVNLLAAFLLWLPSRFGAPTQAEGIIANLITAMSNLLPIEGYDGYGALRAIIRAFDKDTMVFEKALRSFSCVLIFILCIFSLYLIDRFGGGYWIFAIFFASMMKKMSRGLPKE